MTDSTATTIGLCFPIGAILLWLLEGTLSGINGGSRSLWRKCEVITRAEGQCAIRCRGRLGLWAYIHLDWPCNAVGLWPDWMTADLARSQARQIRGESA